MTDQGEQHSPEGASASPDEGAAGEFSSDFPDSFSSEAPAGEGQGEWGGADWTWTGAEGGEPDASKGDPSTGGSTPVPSIPNASPFPSAPPNEGNTLTGGFGTDVPHWTDPPTREVPEILPDEEGEVSENLEGWSAEDDDTGAPWRDDAEDWDDVPEIHDLGGDETRVGLSEPGDPAGRLSFGEDFEESELAGAGGRGSFDDELGEDDDRELGGREIGGRRRPVASGLGRFASRRRRAEATESAGLTEGGEKSERGEKAGGGRDLTSAVAVGLGLIILLVVAYAVGSKALLVLAAAVLVACAVEAYAMIQRRGFRPASVLGAAGVGGVVLAAYWRGTEALAIVTAVVFVATMAWYLLKVVDARPLANVSASLMIYLWIGFLGSFAALLLRAPDGRGLLLGAVLPTVAADILAYIVGSRIGSRTFAPGVSPSKTVEGVLAGGIAALIVGAIIGSQVAPWGGFKHGLALGLMIAILAPVGDLFESMVKRDLAVKDSGSTLPGHGGLLDRFDSLLIVLPATYYLASLFNLHV